MRIKYIKGIVLLLVGVGLLFPQASFARRTKVLSPLELFLEEHVCYIGHVDLSSVPFYFSIGIKPGDTIVEVGTGSAFFLADVTGYLGGSYLGFDLDIDSQTSFINRRMDYISEDGGEFNSASNVISWQTSQGGNVKHTIGLFSAGSPYSADIADSSVRFVFGVTSVLGDPRPVSNAYSVLDEMLRIVQDGGEIITGRYVPTEIFKERHVIRKVLNSERWRGKVELIPIASGHSGFFDYTRYRVVKKD